ncbi:unnamed protein product [Closterium sp. NIES-65]|nr:unnamed protein product [Closterium sp. NIES-65]
MRGLQAIRAALPLELTATVTSGSPKLGVTTWRPAIRRLITAIGLASAKSPAVSKQNPGANVAISGENLTVTQKQAVAKQESAASNVQRSPPNTVTSELQAKKDKDNTQETSVENSNDHEKGGRGSGGGCSGNSDFDSDLAPPSLASPCPHPSPNGGESADRGRSRLSPLPIACPARPAMCDFFFDGLTDEIPVIRLSADSFFAGRPIPIGPSPIVAMAGGAFVDVSRVEGNYSRAVCLGEPAENPAPVTATDTWQGKTTDVSKKLLQDQLILPERLFQLRGNGELMYNGADVADWDDDDIWLAAAKSPDGVTVSVQIDEATVNLFGVNIELNITEDGSATSENREVPGAEAQMALLEASSLLTDPSSFMHDAEPPSASPPFPSAAAAAAAKEAKNGIDRKKLFEWPEREAASARRLAEAEGASAKGAATQWQEMMLNAGVAAIPEAGRPALPLVATIVMPEDSDSSPAAAGAKDSAPAVSGEGGDAGRVESEEKRNWLNQPTSGAVEGVSDKGAGSGSAKGAAGGTAGGAGGTAGAGAGPAAAAGKESKLPREESNGGSSSGKSSDGKSDKKVHRNLDPALHPLEKAKEYQRALNAVKLDKVFAKPFMGALGSHADGVSAMARSPVRLNCVVSASMDGGAPRKRLPVSFYHQSSSPSVSCSRFPHQPFFPLSPLLFFHPTYPSLFSDVRLWDVPYKRTLCRFVGHSRAVRGVAISADGKTMLSCGDDCTAWAQCMGAVHVLYASACPPPPLTNTQRAAVAATSAEIKESTQKSPRGAIYCRVALAVAYPFPPHLPHLSPSFSPISHTQRAAVAATSAGDQGVGGGRGELGVAGGDSENVRLWQLPAPEIMELGVAGGDVEHEAVATFQGKNAFRAVDHKWKGRVFATAGAQVDVWEHSRSDPISTFTWGADSLYSLRFNPAEPDVFATTGSDRSICLYDLRMSTPLRKVIMQTKTNSLAWNPREPLNFTAGNENGSCYSYDMRNLTTASLVHKDHVSAVMDIDYSPTGREFVTGSYDRTALTTLFSFSSLPFTLLARRLSFCPSSHSLSLSRWQRVLVFCVRFSGDGSYVLSGSDDANIRLWKAQASQQLGVQVSCHGFSGDGSYVLSGSDDANIRLWKAQASQQLGVQVKREKRKAEYNAALVERHQPTRPLSPCPCLTALHSTITLPLTSVACPAGEAGEEQGEAGEALSRLKTRLITHLCCTELLEKRFGAEYNVALVKREKRKAEYNAALVERHQHLPEIRRIHKCVGEREGGRGEGVRRRGEGKGGREGRESGVGRGKWGGGRGSGQGWWEMGERWWTIVVCSVPVQLPIFVCPLFSHLSPPHSVLSPLTFYVPSLPGAGICRDIKLHRHVPRPIHNAIKLRATMVAAEKRKEENRQRFKKKSKGLEKKDNKKKGERRNKIIAELE